MKYRREIDGLRALAVLPVVLFHAGVSAFSGGFLGVDVFFVISGYLITGILVEERTAGTFSLSKFYERRARRILPALIVVVLASCIVGWALLLPKDMGEFSRSVIATFTFASNFFFWRNTGYFDSATELKPLLHTWSLAVEEQFYVLFPLFLAMMWRHSRKAIVGVVAGAAVLSLVMAAFLAPRSPAADFYLLPTRGWELMIGCLLALWRERIASPQACDVRAMFGVLLIVGAFLCFDDKTPHPSLYTLVPVIGTAFVIWFAGPTTLAGRALGSRALVGCGLISYSMYLWHQPVFAFARYKSGVELGVASIVLLISVTLLLAYLTWRYVEVPFRDRARIRTRRIVEIVSTASLCLVGAGVLGAETRGFEWRMTKEQMDVLRYEDYDFRSHYAGGKCFLDPEQLAADFSGDCSDAKSWNLLFWGDSHAAALWSGAHRVSAAGMILLAASGCPPAVGLGLRDRPNCKGVNDFILRHVSEKKPSFVILHANWIRYPRSELLRRLGDTIDAVQAMSTGTKIIVLGPVPQWHPTLPAAMVRQGLTLTEGEPVQTPRLMQLRSLEAEVRQVAMEHGARFVSALDAFCSEDKCVSTARLGQKLMPIAWDYGHLTEAGAARLFRNLHVAGTGASP